MAQSINGPGQFTCAWCHADQVSLGHIGVCRQYNGRVAADKVDEILALKEVERQKRYLQESALLKRTLLDVSRSLSMAVEMVDYTAKVSFTLPASMDVTDVLSAIVDAVGRKTEVELLDD